MNPLDIVTALWGDGWHSLCAKRNGETFRTVAVYATPEELLDAARRLDGQDVWWGIHGMADPPGKRGTADDVTSVVALKADVDWDDPVHKDAGLPDEATTRARLSRLGAELAPSVVVHSGHGLQLYWLLDHDVGAEAGADLQAALDRRLGELELQNDRGDLASVLRVPGSTNYKADPIPVIVEQADLGRRYAPEYLRKRLPQGRRHRDSGRSTGARFTTSLEDVVAHLEATGRHRDLEVLTAMRDHHQAHSPYLDAADVLRVTRPGTTAGSSASIGYTAPGELYMHSPSWPPFQPKHRYALTDILALTNGHTEPDGEAPARLRLASRRMSSVQPEDVSWLWFGRLPLGKVVVLDGDPAVGKSTMTTDLAARVSTGAPMPDEVIRTTPGDVVIMSAEDGLADTIRPRLDAAGADTSRVHAVIAVKTIDDDGVVSERPPSIPDDVALLEELVRRTGAKLVIVDVLMAYLAGTTNSYRDQDVRLALTPLAMMAERCGCCVLVLRHVRKASTGNAIYAGGGSIGIIGAARVGLIAGYDPDDDNPDENQRRRVLAVVKCNIAAKQPSLGYAIVSAGAVGRIDWHGPVAHRADDLVDHDSRDDERADKEVFLRDLLAYGSVPAKDVEKAARGDGWTIKQLRPVLKRLGGRAVKRGGYFGGDPGWAWTLSPADAEDATEDAEDAHIHTRSPSASSGHLQDEDDDPDGLRCSRCGRSKTADGRCMDPACETNEAF